MNTEKKVSAMIPLELYNLIKEEGQVEQRNVSAQIRWILSNWKATILEEMIKQNWKGGDC